jgi:hypothetical protein
MILEDGFLIKILIKFINMKNLDNMLRRSVKLTFQNNNIHIYKNKRKNVLEKDCFADNYINMKYYLNLSILPK